MIITGLILTGLVGVWLTLALRGGEPIKMVSPPKPRFEWTWEEYEKASPSRQEEMHWLRRKQALEDSGYKQGYSGDGHTGYFLSSWNFPFQEGPYWTEAGALSRAHEIMRTTTIDRIYVAYSTVWQSQHITTLSRNRDGSGYSDETHDQYEARWRRDFAKRNPEVLLAYDSMQVGFNKKRTTARRGRK